MHLRGKELLGHSASSPSDLAVQALDYFSLSNLSILSRVTGNSLIERAFL
jgi:hypothetical protein